MVYVISKDGQPLMPMRRHGKVRRLLDAKQAKVVHKNPFTIKLLFETEETESDLTLGVDTGSSKIGCAVVTPKKEVLYMSEVEIRNDINKKMERRKVYRRARRIRKLRYRKPRFLNRGNSTKKDRFSPTMISKINSRIREIEFIKSILPVSIGGGELAPLIFLIFNIIPHHLSISFTYSNNKIRPGPKIRFPIIFV